MNAKLALIQRRMERQTPEKPPVPEGSHGLGAAIESLIADEVERRVGDALERHSPKVDRLMQGFNKPAPVSDYRQLPPVARTPAPKAMDFSFQRDELGRISMVSAGNTQWRVQRGALGEIVRMIPADIAPMPPALPAPALAAAREYQPGEAR